MGIEFRRMPFWNITIGFAALLSFALTACGDDDSGVTPRDEDSSSSSQNVIQSVDSREKSSNSSRHSGQDPESSNSKKVSSSSKKIASSSSSKNVIQSIDSREKSSSSSRHSGQDPESSSSKQSSSSVIPASSGNHPSSSSKQDGGSMSAMTESSSSEYVPFDHSKTLAEEWRVGENAYKQFTDTRNGRSYYYIKIVGERPAGRKDSVTIMAENLNIGEMVSGKKNQNDDDKIERYCYNNDTTYCDEFGGLYQWAEMMQLPSRCNTESCADLIQENHQGICPDGWRLMTYKDFYIAWHAETNTNGVEGLRSMYGFNGYNSSGLSFVGAGIKSEGKFSSLKDMTIWFYPSEYNENRAYASALSANNDFPPSNKDAQTKVDGTSVRCVMVEKQ